MGFTLDTGAFIALQRRKQRAWRFVELASRDDLVLRAPADVLTEFWRGTPIIRPLATLIDVGISWIDVTPHLGAVDALVATVAATFGDVVLTSDAEDFARLTRHFTGLRVLAV